MCPYPLRRGGHCTAEENREPLTTATNRLRGPSIPFRQQPSEVRHRRRALRSRRLHARRNGPLESESGGGAHLGGAVGTRQAEKRPGEARRRLRSCRGHTFAFPFLSREQAQALLVG
jgi:hypothetical protein